MLIPPELNIGLEESVADNARGATKVSPASVPTTNTTRTTRMCTSVCLSVHLMSTTNWKAAQVASRPQFAFASAQQFKVLSARCQCQSDRIAWGSPSWTKSPSQLPVATAAAVTVATSSTDRQSRKVASFAAAAATSNNKSIRHRSNWIYIPQLPLV